METRHLPDLVALGSALRRLRSDLDLTPEQLASRLGWSQDLVSGLENGRYGVPSLPLLARLATALELSLSDLIKSGGLQIEESATTRRACEDGVRQGIAEQMLTSVAHDLRNHLTLIKGRIDILRRHAEGAGNTELVAEMSRISRSLDRLSHMTVDLLDVSRLDGAGFSLVMQPCDLIALVRDVIEEAALDRPEIEAYLPVTLVVEGDPGRLAQALRNLMGNAVRHTPRHVAIMIAARKVSRDGREWAVVEVHDEGPGIPPELLPVLFARHTTGGKTAGLGLGLHLARRIAVAHDGDLTVCSDAGKGTTFAMTLPIATRPHM